MRYHFRRYMFGHIITDQANNRVEVEELERALLLALQFSQDDSGRAVSVCRDSGTVDIPGYTEVAWIRSPK